jgi:cellulose biosynthesis protein BcsQ
VPGSLTKPATQQSRALLNKFHAIDPPGHSPTLSVYSCGLSNRVTYYLSLLGVLVTLHDKRTTLAREVHEQIKKVFGPKLFETVITKSVRLEESPAYKESIFSFAPNSSGAIEYGNLCDEVMKRV